MLYILKSGRKIAVAVFVFWAGISPVSLAFAWEEFFAAMGSLLLSLAVAVVLAERYEANERRRLWDHDLQGQVRLIAGIANRAHGNAAGARRWSSPSPARCNGALAPCWCG